MIVTKMLLERLENFSQREEEMVKKMKQLVIVQVREKWRLIREESHQGKWSQHRKCMVTKQVVNR